MNKVSEMFQIFYLISFISMPIRKLGRHLTRNSQIVDQCQYPRIRNLIRDFTERDPAPHFYLVLDPTAAAQRSKGIGYG